MANRDEMRPENAPFDGRWWCPEDPGKVVGGRLELTRGVWGLSLFGWLGDWNGARDDNSVPPIIHGEVGTAPVTLFDLVQRGWRANGADPPYQTGVAANTVIVGTHCDAGSRYSRAGVRLVHLNEWANRRPWSFERTSNSGHEHGVRFVDPGELRACLPGADASLWRGWGQEGGDLSSVTMNSDEWVYFDFEEPLALEALEHDWIRPLRNLVELASAQRSPTLDVRVTREGADEYETEATVLSAMSSAEGAFEKMSFQFLFTLNDIGFDVVLPRWWELSAEIGVVADLMAALRDGGGYVSPQFLTAASAIEGYHRHREARVKKTPQHNERLARITSAVSDDDDRVWLNDKLAFSHEPSFADRARAVIDRAGPLFPPMVGNVEAWLRWVKHGRNSVAHRDPEMVNLDEEWQTTVRVTATIQWLVTLVLLRDLGLSDEVIERGVRRDRGVESATNYLRERKPEWFAGA